MCNTDIRYTAFVVFNIYSLSISVYSLWTYLPNMAKMTTKNSRRSITSSMVMNTWNISLSTLNDNEECCVQRFHR